MNAASILGDIAHTAAIFLLLGWMGYKKSCEGISGKTQVLNAIVCTTRYLDLVTSFINYYLTIMKIFFIIVAYLTIIYIYILYKKTYEREYDAFWGETLIVLCLGLGLLETYDITQPEEVLYAFSRYLEAAAFIPQLYFTYKKEFKSYIITYYVTFLIMYRAFYITNWIIRYEQENFLDPYITYSGVVQFILYFIYFILPSGKPSDLLPTTIPPNEIANTTDVTSSAIVPIPRTPNITRQESLLETPFLKRNAASYSSVYTIGRDSQNSSPSGSVINLNMAVTTNREGRY